MSKLVLHLFPPILYFRFIVSGINEVVISNVERHSSVICLFSPLEIFWIIPSLQGFGWLGRCGGKILCVMKILIATCHNLSILHILFQILGRIRTRFVLLAWVTSTLPKTTANILATQSTFKGWAVGSYLSQRSKLLFGLRWGVWQYSTVISTIQIRCSIFNYEPVPGPDLPSRIRQDTLTVTDTSVSMSLTLEYLDHGTSSLDSDLWLVHVHSVRKDI